MILYQHEIGGVLRLLPPADAIAVSGVELGCCDSDMMTVSSEQREDGPSDLRWVRCAAKAVHRDDVVREGHDFAIGGQGSLYPHHFRRRVEL